MKGESSDGLQELWKVQEVQSIEGMQCAQRCGIVHSPVHVGSIHPNTPQGAFGWMILHNYGNTEGTY